MFDWPAVQAAVPDWKISYHDSLDSTSRQAARQVAEFSGPTVVIADVQTAGKGRGSNRWHSEAGALTFTVVIQPRQWQLPVSEQTLLSLVTAACLRSVIIELTDMPGRWLQLKWPNDIYLQGKKVCGILLEQITQPTETLLIGIGLNVNNSLAAAPADVQAKGISLIDVHVQPLSREDLLIAFLRKLSEVLADAELRASLWRAAWNSSHLLTGQVVQLDRAGQLLLGRCEGIDDDGALLLRDAYGLHRIHSAVVIDWETPEE